VSTSFQMRSTLSQMHEELLRSNLGFVDIDEAESVEAEVRLGRDWRAARTHPTPEHMQGAKRETGR
jgi:hypothetical protein